VAQGGQEQPLVEGFRVRFWGIGFRVRVQGLGLGFANSTGTTQPPTPPCCSCGLLYRTSYPETQTQLEPGCVCVRGGGGLLGNSTGTTVTTVRW
jgi:hypothetical protein